MASVASAAAAAVAIATAIVEAVKISRKALKEADLLVQKLNLSAWHERFTSDTLLFPKANLGLVIEDLPVDDEVKAVLRSMKHITCRGSTFDQFDYVDSELKIHHAFLAAFNDGESISLFYMVYRVEAKLTKTGIFSILDKEVRLTVEERDLIKHTFIPHQLLLSLKSKNVIQEITYSQ